MQPDVVVEDNVVCFALVTPASVGSARVVQPARAERPGLATGVLRHPAAIAPSGRVPARVQRRDLRAPRGVQRLLPERGAGRYLTSSSTSRTAQPLPVPQGDRLRASSPRTDVASPRHLRQPALAGDRGTRAGKPRHCPRGRPPRTAVAVADYGSGGPIFTEKLALKTLFSRFTPLGPNVRLNDFAALVPEIGNW